MKLIDGDHLKRWILARWEAMAPQSSYPLRAYDIIEQIDREDYYEVESGWKKCSEELPTMTTDVLVTVGVNYYGEGMHNEVRTATWHTVNKKFYVHETKDAIIGEVIAWKDAPLPYGGEGECG